MIGNDVVDLELTCIQSNWRRKGFLDKVFHDHEQHEIFSANDPEKMVWLLWSMKEAAYKAHQRVYDLPRKLNWQQQKCIITSCSPEKASGFVKISGSTYSISSEINTEFIHTSAVSDINLSYDSAVMKISSAEMKEVLLEVISGATSVAEKERLLFEKDKHGMPFVSCGDSRSWSSFSLSSHGRFSAFSMSLMYCKMPVKHY